VIAAAQDLRDRVRLGDQVAPMRADVGETVNLVLGVPRQEERLVEESLEERDRMDRPRHPHALQVRDELPGACENPLANAVEDGRVRVEAGRQGGGPADVGFGVGRWIQSTSGVSASPRGGIL
jgi:hypothetical protein